MSTNLSDPADLAVAVDIGGTFTDVMLQDQASGRAWRAKVPSLPADPSRAFLDGLRAALACANGSGAGRIGRVLHGTTIATNMILEGKGARAALVTTEGFRHVLGAGRRRAVPARRGERSRRGGGAAAAQGGSGRDLSAARLRQSRARAPRRRYPARGAAGRCGH